MANTGKNVISGIYGSAYRDGQQLLEVIEFQAPVEIGRIAVPQVGTAKEGRKRGRETREGNMIVHKYDSKWDLFVFQSVLSTSEAARRSARDDPSVSLPSDSFSLVLSLNDPEAVGVERWQLNEVRLWRLPLGINIGDELTQREYPITWEDEFPLTAFLKTTNSSGRPAANYVYGSA